MTEPDDELARRVALLRTALASEEEIAEFIRVWRKSHAPASDDGQATAGADEAPTSDGREQERHESHDGAGRAADEEPQAESPPPREAAGGRKTPRDEGPPQDIGLEMDVLGALMENASAVAAVGEILVPIDFFLAAHQKIYAAIIALDARGDPIGRRTVKDELTRRHQLDEVGGASYLSTLADKVTDATNVVHHARILRDISVCRQVRTTGFEIATLGTERRDDADAILDKAEGKVLAIAQGRRADARVDMADAVDELIHRIEHPGEVPAPSRTATGYPFIDSATRGGLRGGHLVFLGARTSLGKTSLAMNIAWNVAKVGGRALFLSLEMSPDELAERLIQCSCRIGTETLDKALGGGDIDPEDLKHMKDLRSAISNGNIVTRDVPGLTPYQARSIARRERARGKLDLIVIDYIQLMHQDSGAKVENRNQELGTISHQLKGLARELDVPVLALAQLNRQVENRPNKKPQLSDMRDSGDLEQDADVVLLIRLADKEVRSNKTWRVNVEFTKNRGGASGLDGQFTFERVCTAYHEGWVPAKP